MKQYLTVKDVAASLQITVSATYTAIERGQIPGVVRFGSRVRIDPDIFYAAATAKTKSKPKMPVMAL